MENDRILRFSRAERWGHWIHAGSFFLLLSTGLVVLSPTFAFLAPLFGGIQGARILHRIAAIFFTIIPLTILVFGDWPGFKRWLWEMITWDADDLQFLKMFPREFFGGQPNLPEQGRFNAGEKVNSLLTLGGGILLTLSGLVMWFPSSLPLSLVRWAYPVHHATAMITAAAMIGHLYLALLHPGTKEAMDGMLKGTVTKKFAASHHAKWYREISGKGGQA